tara:strand:- start:147 stop:305 length:159 start_codon:yes stop_codon:yes gene_type:complete
MILNILIDETTHQVDVGDVSAMTNDQKTDALHTAMTDLGLDPTQAYVIVGEA